MKTETILIAAWLKKNGGARRYEAGFSSTFLSIQTFLQARGITVTCFKRRYKVSSGKGRPKISTWDEVLRMLDDIRTAEGLEPLRQKHAA